MSVEPRPGIFLIDSSATATICQTSDGQWAAAQVGLGTMRPLGILALNIGAGPLKQARMLVSGNGKLSTLEYK